MNDHFVSRRKCPVCMSTESREIYRNSFTESPIREYLLSFYSSQGMIEFEYLEDATYRLVECRSCRLIFQQEIPGDKLTQRLYEHWIDPEHALRQYGKRNGLDAYARHAEKAMQLIAHFQSKPSSLSFLDFGMGWGTWARMVKAFGCNSYGLDLSSSRSDHAQSDGITVLSREDLGGHRFDFINADWVFEHIPNPLETLVDLRKALKKGGLVGISVPTAGNIEERLRVMDWDAPKESRNSLNPVAPLEHINCFRRETLLRLAAIAGMKEVHLPVTRRFQLADRLATARRIMRNVILPLLPGLRRDYAVLADAGIPVDREHPVPALRTRHHEAACLRSDVIRTP